MNVKAQEYEHRVADTTMKTIHSVVASMFSARCSSFEGLLILLLLAVLRMTAFAAGPQIRATASLQHKAVDIGRATSFAVTAVGDDLRYQWWRDGQDLTGETNKVLTLAAATPGDEGDYTVEVRNAEGWAVSEPARLWVVPRAADFVKDNCTNSAGQRLPFFYLLPANYDPTPQSHRAMNLRWFQNTGLIDPEAACLAVRNAC